MLENSITHPGAAVMIPIHADGKIHLVKQWRRTTKEIGYKAQKLTYLGVFFTAPGFCNEYLHLFLAQDLIKSSPPGDDSEKTDHCLPSLEQAMDAIDNQVIKDAKTICGIYRYFRRKTQKEIS